MKLISLLTSLILLSASTWAQENTLSKTCNKDNICVGEKYYELFYLVDYMLDAPVVVTVLSIQPNGKLIVQSEKTGNITKNWRSSQLAKMTGCNEDNICVGEKYYELYFTDGPVVMTVLAIQPNGKVIAKSEKTGKIYKNWKSSQLVPITQ